MNSGPIDPFSLAAFSFLPLIFFFVWCVVVLGMTIFGIVMVVRFVRAHERIARQLEVIAGKDVPRLETPATATVRGHE